MQPKSKAKRENKSINWIVDIYKNREKLEKDFIEKKLYTSVYKIAEDFKCARMSVYYYLNHPNSKAEKLNCLKITRVSVPIRVDNPEYINLIK